MVRAASVVFGCRLYETGQVVGIWLLVFFSFDPQPMPGLLSNNLKPKTVYRPRPSTKPAALTINYQLSLQFIVRAASVVFGCRLFESRLVIG
jgi:hypothetical protein